MGGGGAGLQLQRLPFPFTAMHASVLIVNCSVAAVVRNCVEDRLQKMVSASVVRDACLCLSSRQHVGLLGR